MDRHRWRLRVAASCAAVCWLLFAVTLAIPDWIEVIFQADPDHGNGSLEWLIVAVLFVAAVALSGVTRREWRRTQPGKAS
jgi:hypothetical protein